MTKLDRFVFVDRDGVINKYPGDHKYVTSLKEFKFLPGARTGIRLLSRAGYRVCVISNQAGVSKGLYTKKTLKEITLFMTQGIEKSGGKIYKALYCTHHPDAGCHCRKPKDGLLRQATRRKKIDPEDTYFIGDSILDVRAGKNFGCKTILVFSGREKAGRASLWEAQPDFVARNLLEAAKNILAIRYERA